jgi:hypothetical protein
MKKSGGEYDIGLASEYRWVIALFKQLLSNKFTRM